MAPTQQLSKQLWSILGWHYMQKQGPPFDGVGSCQFTVVLALHLLRNHMFLV